MIKTGRPFRSVSFLFLFSILFSSVYAQEVSVEATLSETNIFAGEGVTLDVVVSSSSLSSLERPTLPDIPGLRWLPNRTSQSSNYSYINGRPSVSQSYGFQLIAEEVGSYTIPPISVQVNGKSYSTKAISFKVLDPKTIDSGQAERSPDIYVRLEPTDLNPVIGQQIIADVVLYFKNGIEVSSYQASPGWKAEGFWKETLENPQRARPTSVILNGVRYQKAKLLQYAIFPTKAGELTLSPFEITIRVRQNRRNIRDPFSFGFAQESKDLLTLPVTINVQRLPEPERGVFNGAVGDLEIKRSIKPASAFVGESIEIITEISGTGNIPLLNKPEYDYPETLEKYNPQENTNITRTNRQIGGTKTFTDIVIARNEGRFEIPAKEVAIYNPSRNAFEYTMLPALAIEAKKDPRAVTTPLTELRLDVKPVKGLASWVSTSYTPLYERGIVWVLIGTPPFLLLLAFGYKTYLEKMSSDVGFARSQKAKSKADNVLADAAKSDNVKEGYHLIQQALNQFITDKLNLPEAGLSSDALVTELQAKTNDAPVQELKKLLTKCETIAYAPGTSQQDLSDDIETANLLIRQISKAL